MIEGITFAISLIILPIITFAPGYVVTRTFLKRQLSEIPFFVALPIYLSVGLCTQIIVSYLVGSMLVASLVPLLVAAISWGVVIFIKITSFKSEFYRIFGSSFSNKFAFVLFVLIFLYFSGIAVEKNWPPVGDAIMHSTLTSKIIEDGNSVQYRPFDPFPYTYPTGYHSFAADFSLLSMIYPAQSIYSVATFTVILLASLLSTLTYLVTRSSWLSLPAALSVLLVHSSGQFERWLAAFLWNGPYPSLFGFMAILSVLVILQAGYRKKGTSTSILPLFIIIILSLIVAYPNFIFHAIVFFLVYFVVLEYTRLKLLIVRFPPRNNRIINYITKKGRQKNLLDVGHSSGLSIETKSHSHSSPLPAWLSTPVIVSVCLVLGFIALFFILGLELFYEYLISFNLGVFQERRDFEYINFQTVWTSFNTDISYKLIIALEFASFLLVLYLRKKIEPLFVAVLILFPALLFHQLGFIYPQRTLTFLAILAWPLVAFAISELKPRTTKIYRSINSEHLIIAGFVCLALILEIPSVVSQAISTPGWYIFERYPNSFETAEWISQNSEADTLILNDRTYSSFYINGFAYRNLTHSYMSGWLKTLPTVWPSDFELMARNLTSIWREPWNEPLVHNLLTENDIKYIAIFEDRAFTNWQNWGGSGVIAGSQRPYTNTQYEIIFSSYGFLELVFKKGNSMIYEVKYG